MRCTKLDLLNISDLNMGQEPVIATLTALLKSEGTVVRKLYCNYNEVDCWSAADECFSLLKEIAEKSSDGRQLMIVDFVGCDSVPKSQRLAKMHEFCDINVLLKLFDDGDDLDDDDEYEEDEDDGENFD